MELSPYIAELRESLVAAAAVGDEASQRSAAALAGALEPAARLVLLHALSDMGAEVTQRLSDAGSADRITVDVRLDGRDVRIVTSRDAPAGSDPAGATADRPADPPGHEQDTTRSFTEVSGDLTRTTVRMFNELKAQAEKAASQQGVSLNAFISRAVADSVKDKKAWKQAREDLRQEVREAQHSARRPSPSVIRGYVQG